jgi:hypothetical protein
MKNEKKAIKTKKTGIMSPKKIKCSQSENKGLIEAPSHEIIENLVLKNDISLMTPQQRVEYYITFCKILGINPLAKPFDVISFREGRTTLYANKTCAEQLRERYKVSIVDLRQTLTDEVCITTAIATNINGRTDSEIGVVPIKGLKGEALSNAMMKSTTKAKRRVTLSICGLGMLDETEVETIPNVKIAQIDIQTGEIKDDNKDNTIKTKEDEEKEKKKQEALKKLDALPQNIKDGFEILGYMSDEIRYKFCVRFGWENQVILAELNKIIDSKEGIK